MYLCEICQKQADIHHIVHRSEGGLDIKLNYKYLCSYHHRGKPGPHHCEETDILYKLELQNNLFYLLQNDYYKFKELMILLEVSKNQLKKIVKNLKVYKEGYKKLDIVVKIMGGKLYTEEMIENLTLDKLIDNIDKEP
ncbi:HNH endonuclease [Clostridium botulinum]|uniref:HNH endonuclease signature motif containing protein n=1 Tax=Clostridium botulinum TaxID=1491 RepID=UPI000772F919|nr:HNH endonuclease signature motif containing protein [Clostridium botulinum]NFH80981.1 HNH endonuclease [Clostridium botulinum]NFH84185.1 HNH endonuclease [Clostridium botulinum]NFI12223.1 HNH endonuclease [Clostridium botulinum]NFI14692.1 HNH endonuclease [Clostridium botulinum]NFO85980.1 HNH endonuclease [Clostridium botulinum]